MSASLLPNRAQVSAKPTEGADRRRWTALAFIAIAQLMIALDATIVSIALPSAQAALGASDADRQWVVTAYALAFGGLLPLGGRVADYAGRKRSFLIGLAGSPSRRRSAAPHRAFRSLLPRERFRAPSRPCLPRRHCPYSRSLS